jgi:hypothetical protein
MNPLSLWERVRVRVPCVEGVSDADSPLRRQILLNRAPNALPEQAVFGPLHQSKKLRFQGHVYRHGSDCAPGPCSLVPLVPSCGHCRCSV